MGLEKLFKSVTKEEVQRIINANRAKALIESDKQVAALEYQQAKMKEYQDQQQAKAKKSKADFGSLGD